LADTEMETVYLDRKDLSIKAEGDALVLYVNGKREGTLPLKPMKRLIVRGNVTLTTEVLHRLKKNGVSFLLLWGKLPSFSLRFEGHLHKNAYLRLSQYKAVLDAGFRLSFAKKLILRKLEGLSRHLEDLATHRGDVAIYLQSASLTIKELVEKVKVLSSLDSLRGCEGAASSTYFSALVHVLPKHFNFQGRNRRPPKDPVNAVLSLSYTLLHWEMVREIELIGLDPFLGFYHELSYGRESLACDLVEPWRPEIDRFVLGLFKEEALGKSDFATVGEGVYLKKEARRKFWLAYEGWAKERRSTWREEVWQLARDINSKEGPLLGTERDIDY